MNEIRDFFLGGGGNNLKDIRNIRVLVLFLSNGLINWNRKYAYRHHHHLSLLSPKADTHFTFQGTVEG